MTTEELLNALETKLSAPGAWCQGAGARDKLGQSVPSTSREAKAWCIKGGLAAVTSGTHWSKAYEEALGLLRQSVRDMGLRDIDKRYDILVQYNDGKAVTQLDIIFLIQKARARANG